MHRSSPLLAGVLAAAALACAAPAALADSIAYIKDGNVWLTTPDGARQFQVTATGGYSDVSQADDGTMIALKGVRLNRLARDGQVLADFDTPVSDTRPAPSKTFYGPYDPAISPDGTKVAYTYYWMTQGTSPTCQPPTCFTTINEGGTGYSYSDRQTAWDAPGLGKHSGWRYPAWVDNDTTLLADPTHLPNNDVILDTLSDGTSGNLVHNWFSDMVGGNPHVSGGDITRDKTKLAFATGANDSTLTVYWVPQFPTRSRTATRRWRPSRTRATATATPRAAAASRSRRSRPAAPRWSSRSGDGIHVAQVPAFAGDCTLNGATNDPPLLYRGRDPARLGPGGRPRAAHEHAARASDEARPRSRCPLPGRRRRPPR